MPGPIIRMIKYRGIAAQAGPEAALNTLVQDIGTTEKLTIALTGAERIAHIPRLSIYHEYRHGWRIVYPIVGSGADEKGALGSLLENLSAAAITDTGRSYFFMRPPGGLEPVNRPEWLAQVVLAYETTAANLSDFLGIGASNVEPRGWATNDGRAPDGFAFDNQRGRSFLTLSYILRCEHSDLKEVLPDGTLKAAPTLSKWEDDTLSRRFFIPYDTVTRTFQNATNIEHLNVLSFLREKLAETGMGCAVLASHDTWSLIRPGKFYVTSADGSLDEIKKVLVGVVGEGSRDYPRVYSEPDSLSVAYEYVREAMQAAVPTSAAQPKPRRPLELRQEVLRHLTPQKSC